MNMGVWRRCRNWALGGVLAFLVGSCGLSTPPPQMHVLLITLDTTRADRLGFDGYSRPTTPHLDALARQSVIFDHAIAQAAVTPVSHASILTGLNPYNHGLRVLHGLVANRLDEEIVSLPEVWKEAGGQTAAFVSAFPVTSTFGLDQGFDVFDADFQRADGAGLVTPSGTVNTGLSQRRADETTRAAMDWLGQQDLTEPVFMWAHYFDPHDDFLAPHPDWIKEMMQEHFPPASMQTSDQLRALYDCEIHFMDQHINRLLRAFEEHGIWDQTIVVVVADHGEGLGDHDWWSHGILYQEQIRVPLLIRIPGVDAAPRVKDLVRTIDIAPTILEAAGIARELWPSFDGVSLSEVMQSGRCTPPRSAYSESINLLTYGRPDSRALRDRKDDKYYCLMTDRHKLIYHQLKPDEVEFFDLLNDPKELTNLAPQQPAEMDSLMRVLASLHALSPIIPGMTATDLERAEKLRSLGYIE